MTCLNEKTTDRRCCLSVPLFVFPEDLFRLYQTKLQDVPESFCWMQFSNTA